MRGYLAGHVCGLAGRVGNGLGKPASNRLAAWLCSAFTSGRRAACDVAAGVEWAAARWAGGQHGTAAAVVVAACMQGTVLERPASGQMALGQRW